MRTDIKVALVAVLVVVLLVITYFAFSHHSTKRSSEGVLPSQQPGLMPATDNTSGASTATTQTSSNQASGGTASAIIPPAASQPAASSQSAPGLVQVNPTTGPAGTNLTASTQNSGAGGGMSSGNGLTTADTGENSGTAATDNSGSGGNLGAGNQGNAGNNGIALSGSGTADNSGSSGVAIPRTSSASGSQGLGGGNNNGGSSGSILGGQLAPHRHFSSHTPRRAAISSHEYRIRKGDTLVRIAVHMYGSARMVRALERANPGLDPRRMRVGQIIHLPRASRASHVSSANSYRSRRHHTVSHSRAGYTVRGRVYVVRAGDSLRGLARRFYRTSAYWKLIYRANRRIIGSNPNNIRVGERLTIPAH